MGARFLNKRLLVMDGFSRGNDDDGPALFFEGDNLVVTRGAKIEGNIDATAAALNTVTAGSGAITNLRIGSSAGNNLITAAWRTVYTWNIPAVPGIVGSTNAVVTQDVAMSGVAIGDFVRACPVGSVALDLHFEAFCFTAASIQLRAWYTGSTGSYTPGNVPFKVLAIKI